MAHTLHISAKDADALKLCISAVLGGKELDVSVLSGKSVPDKLDVPLPSLGCPVLATASGTVIQDVNTAAIFLGGEKVAQVQLAVDDLLEYHSSTLFPALLKRAAGDYDESVPLERIEGALKGSKFLAQDSDSPSAADICIGIDLLTYADTSNLPKSVATFLERLKALPAFAASLKQLALPEDLASVREAATTAASARLPKLPKPGARNVLITSALPYVNNVPHLGNIIGCVLSADVYSRYCRARGYNSIYICGTDEYGTATETKALEEGATCQQICDRYHAIHKRIYDWFEIDFDKFGRTPSRAQTKICQSVFNSIHTNGHTATRTNEQLYSTALDKFLADRYVVGTCPKCAYDDARGDQCDNCGSLLNPTELKEPRCKFSGTKPELRETTHLYIDLPALEPRLRAYISDASSQGGWSANCKSSTDAWLKGGLKERCITRDLKWGTPVPLEGFESKVFYVWFDAPIGYVSITANYTPEWEQWWRNPDDVELVQFMGKDNVTFHTIIFPSTLLGTGEKWTMMRKISVTEFLNYEGGKFSKSRGTGVFGDGAMATGIPSDVFRYYLLASRPESNDSDFRWADLAQRNNSELLKNLGNFVNRVVSFTFNKLEAETPAAAKELPEVVKALNIEMAGIAQQYLDLLENLKIRDAVAKVLQASAAGNKFLQDSQFWTLPKEQSATVIAAALGLVKLLAAMLAPYMPSTTRAMHGMLNAGPDWGTLGQPFLDDAAQLHTAVPPGHKLAKPVLLFSEISDETVEQLQHQFSGSQAAQAATAAGAAGGGGSGGGKAAPPPPGTPAASGTSASSSKGCKSAATQAATEADSKAKGGKNTTNDTAKKGSVVPAAQKEVNVSRLDLRVGLITSAKKHPTADSLYVEDILCGEEAPRVVVSGLVNHIPEPEMQQRLVVVIANLKPANLKSIKSHAMVLAATSTDGKVELVDPPIGSKPGERVYVDGFDGEPDSQLNPKHKVFEAVHPDFSTSDDLVACYKGKPLLTSLGPCTVKTVKGGTIK